MLLDEDPAVLINECIGNFNIAPDRSALSRINGSLSTLSQARELRLSSLQATLKKLSRQHSTLVQRHHLTLSNHDPTEHAQHMLALDTQKFRIAKEASDLEIEGERLEGDLRGAEATIRELDGKASVNSTSHGHGYGQPVAEGEDQDILKLKLYRSLGVDIEADSTGRYNRAVVRNMARGTANVTDIDPKVSKAYYANHFWQAMG